MADELLRSRHGFGAYENVSSAIESGAVDEHDLLLTKDAEGNPHFGWVEKDGNPIFLDTDTSEIEANVEALESEIASKANSDEVNAKIAEVDTKVDGVKEEVLADVDAKIEDRIDNSVEDIVGEKLESVIEKTFEKVDYEISYKPNGTLVNEHDKEIRVMCPSDTAWSLQDSGEGANPNNYYIGFKAFAPSDDVVSFKEDLAEIITDDTMYYFEDNDFAGIDENGRKYSIVWFPVAIYEDGVWTYYGTKSTKDHYIGWYYSVEWYNADGKVVASDCVRVNLSNEDCHSAIEPFYMSNIADNAVVEANTYTDEQITNVLNMFTVVEI